MKGPAVRAAVLAIVLAATAGVTLAADPPPRIDWSSEVGYSYDGSGNITAIGPQSFTYDAGSRLVQEVLPDGSIRSYRYDGFGNRTGCSDGSGVTCLTSESGTPGTNGNRTAAAVYDLTGNVTGFNGHTFTYDVLNMMTSDVSPSGVRRDFVYTADDQRIAVFHQPAQGAGWWRWTVRDLSGKVLREFTANGLGLDVVPVWEKDYVWRDGKLLATLQREVPSGPVTTYRYHLDHLGTPRRITKDAATSNEAVGVHDYFAYGSETGGGQNEPSLTRMKFTGHERDVVDGEPYPLDYMVARYYAPTMGRFLSVDPKLDLDKAVKEPQRWNRYSYVVNNPVRYTDPDGREHVQEPGFTKPLSEAGGWADQPSVSWAFYAQGALLTAAAGELGLGRAIATARGVIRLARGESTAGGDLPASRYKDSTTGRSIPNRETNVSRGDFGKNLEANGFTKSTSKDGKATIYEKDGVTYTVRDTSKSGGPTAEVFKNGKLIEKIRLEKTQ